MASVVGKARDVITVMRHWTSNHWLLLMSPPALSHPVWSDLMENGQMGSLSSLEEWEASGLGCNQPQHLCPLVPPECHQWSWSWSSGSFVGEPEEDQVQLPRFSLLLHPNSYWIFGSLWPTYFGVPKGPQWPSQAGYGRGELVDHDLPSPEAVCGSSKRQCSIRFGNECPLLPPGLSLTPLLPACALWTWHCMFLTIYT